MPGLSGSGSGSGVADVGVSLPHATAKAHATSAAIMRLIEQGKLTLDDTLQKFVPNFPTQGNRVTVRHLLNHTSGLVDVLDPVWYRKGYEPTSKELVKMIAREQNVRFAPGEKFEYNNTGYVLLALIVGKVSGQSFARFMKESIFKPLGMANSSWRRRAAW